MIPADLQQNINITIELTFLHNYWAIFYFVGLCLSFLWGIWRPSRAIIFAILGFALLLFAFEYEKHILEPLKEQTVNSIITMQEHNKVRRILNLSLVKLVPAGSFLGGATALITASFLGFKNSILASKIDFKTKKS